jgi:nitrogen fixation NifU-like protein
MSGANDFEGVVKELQQKIDRDEEETYSKKVIEEYRNPSNFGFIENPDVTGQVKGPCGDTMRMYLRIKDNVIQEARFWTDGCGASLACGNMLTSMIKGKNIDEADNISSEQLLEVLDGLPDEHQHCAKLAVDTLHKATEDYNKKGRIM